MTSIASVDEINGAINDQRIIKAFSPSGTVIDLSNFYDIRKNVALKVEGGIGLFCYMGDGVYEGHYVFTDLKGKALMKQAKAMIDLMFTRFGASVILGYTPRDNRAARFISRSLGFIATGNTKIDSLGRDCIEYRLEAKKWAM